MLLAYSIPQLAIYAIIIAAIIGVVFVAFRQFGVTIPAFVVQIFWIVVCAAVALFAIKFLLTI